jgi:O-antigen/teichoic acid export membrane protein
MERAAASPLAPASDSGVVHRSALVLALQIVIQARGLIQVPFLTRALTADELGSLTLAMSVAGTAGVLALLGLHTGFFLNLVRLEAARSRAAVVSVFAVGLPLVGVISMASTLALRARVGGRWLDGVQALALPLGLLIAGTALREIAMVVPRARQDIRFYWANSLWLHYGGLVVGLVLVLRGHGPRGFLIGLGAGALSGALVALAYSLRRTVGRAVWDSPFALQVARSAYPVVPMALAQMSLLSLDYVFVSRFLGSAALATYGLAYTFASPVMLMVGVLNVTLLPEYVARHRRGDAELLAFVEGVLAWGWTAGLAAVAAASLLGPDVIEAVAGKPYRAAGELLPAIVASYVLFALGQVLHIVRSAVVADVRASAVVTVLCAIVNAAASFRVIPTYGLRGAAATTLASFILYFLAMTAVVRPILPGTVASMRPWILLPGLAVVPFALLLDSSPVLKALLALAVGALAVLAFLRVQGRMHASPQEVQCRSGT